MTQVQPLIITTGTANLCNPSHIKLGALVKKKKTRGLIKLPARELGVE